MLLAGLAIAPGLAICLYIFYKDKYDREPALTLLVSFVLGMMITVPAVAVEWVAKDFTEETVAGILISSFFFIALVEEASKFLPLRYYAFTRKSFDEPLDGIVHSVMIAMGFATVENMAYVFSTSGGLQTGLLRMFTGVPAHATFAIIMGYYTGKAKFDLINRKALLLKGLLLATFIHGAYDSFLYLTKVLPGSFSTSLLVGAAVGSLVFAIVLSLRLLRLHRKTSHLYYHGTPDVSIRVAALKDIPLIRSMAGQVWPKTYATIISPGQVNYMMKLMYSEKRLEEQMKEHHQFLIAYNNGIPAGFAAYSQMGDDVFKLHKLYVLPSQQGKGTGKFIIEAIINEIRKKGAHTLSLNVNRYNKAKLFYEKLGFEVIGSEDVDIGNGFYMNDFIMQKKLGAAELMTADDSIADDNRLASL